MIQATTDDAPKSGVITLASHTSLPWMTQPCGELLPDDVMIVADMGRTTTGIQRISTVARVLSIRQTKEVTGANAAFIVKAANNHDALLQSLEEMVGVYWGEGDGIKPPPACIIRAQAAIKAAKQ